MACMIYYYYPDEEVREDIRSIFGLDDESPELIECRGTLIDDLRELIAMLGAKSENERVVYIPDGSALTPSMQDCLLKTAEDCSEITFVIKSNVRMRPTVESRSRIRLKARIRSEFNDLYRKKTGAEPAEYLYGMLPDPERAAAYHDNAEFHGIMAQVYDAVINRKGTSCLMTALGLMREKDKGSFFDLYPELIPGLYDLFLGLYLQRLEENPYIRTLDSLRELAVHARKVRNKGYARNDMVDLVIRM